MTLVGFRAKNHPQQVAQGGPVGDVDDRRTPRVLFDAYNARHHFTVDAVVTWSAR